MVCVVKKGKREREVFIHSKFTVDERVLGESIALV